MIRLFNVHFPERTLLLAVSEAALVVMSLLFAATMSLGHDTGLMLAYEQGYLKIAVVSAVCMLCMYYYDLYDSLILANPREVTTRLIQVLGTACLVLAVLYYAFPGLQLGRRILLIGVFLVLLFGGLCRRMFVALNRIPRLAERAILLGAGALASRLNAEIDKRPELGIRVVGYLGRPPHLDTSNGLARLGEVDDLSAVLQRENGGRVIITMDDRRGRLPVEVLLQLKTRGVWIQDGADFYEAVTGRVSLDSLRLSYLLFSPGFRVSPGRLFFKRFSSVVLSCVGLVLALPIMCVAAVAIWLDSKGPIIFRQTRVGANGKLFTVYKFRSMSNGVDASSAKPAQANDKRFTRVGRLIRPFRLDELPQLYNILRGDMYFVGPRPFVPEQEAVFLKQIPFYAHRLSIKPGATGWAQIHRGYCATLEDNIEKLEYDLFYIKNLSIGLDLLIIFQTLKTVLLGRGAR